MSWFVIQDFPNKPFWVLVLLPRMNAPDIIWYYIYIIFKKKIYLFVISFYKQNIQNININFKTKFIRYTFQNVEDTGSFVLFKKTAYEYKMIFNWINLVFEKKQHHAHSEFFHNHYFLLETTGVTTFIYINNPLHKGWYCIVVSKKKCTRKHIEKR